MAEVPEARVVDAAGVRDTGQDFIREIVEDDLRRSVYGGRVATRFPPEPNGYLHVGHAKAIVLNFGIAAQYGGVCNLRFDDTNPETEDLEYVEAIKRDVRWLGYDWGDRLYFASDYFEQFYTYAVDLIKKGKAYVDSLSEDEIRAGRGTVTEPGRESPDRNRSVEENLDLFERMRAGEFPEGAHVLRARGDMASPNMKMRDPLLYRIRHARHYRRGDAWCIYPMYDYAHPLEDALEGITHSLCTLEFENNREVYDWVLDNLYPAPRPHQYEFARLSLEYTVLSKRRLLELVRGGQVDGWDDPRMPTISGMRRRGVTPEAIRAFCERVGVAKANSRIDHALFEHTVRSDLNFIAPRVMCVLRPLKVVITNFPEGEVEWLQASYWPHDIPKEGSRRIPFTRELFIERDDFDEDPPRGYYRMAPGREVRLRYGFLVTCTDVVRDGAGEIVEVYCTYDPASRGGNPADGRKVPGTIHWVSADRALRCEVRVYDRLFSVPDPDEGDGAFTDRLNPESLVTQKNARIEPSVVDDPIQTRYQFERQGYFWRDPVDSAPDALVFNRIISLRDSWAKKQPSVGKRPPDGRASEDAPDASAIESPPRAAVRTEISRMADPLERLSPDERQRVARYTKELNLQLDDALILAQNPPLAEFFDQLISLHPSPQLVANWMIHELLRDARERPLDRLPFGPVELSRLIALIDDGTISSRTAKDIYAQMLQHGGDPEQIVREGGLEQVSDLSQLRPVVEGVLAQHPQKVAEFRQGKTGLIGFFVGQAMRETQGTANPELVRRLLEERLGS